MLRNKLYYQIKPFVPWSVRMGIRRWFALRKRGRVRDVWPIRPGSEVAPKGWTGWPDGKKFAFVLTHDIEGQRGLDRCLQLMRLEKDLGFRSSFNFIPEGEYSTPLELRDALSGNGFEVGIHDLRHDGKLYRSRAEFVESAKKINAYVKEWKVEGFRSGFMHHNLDWIQDLDVRYDASTFDTDPFEPQPDAAGTIFPFIVKGTNGRRGYVELPYTLPQDSSMFLLFRERNIDIWKKKLDWVALHGGMVLVNTHPDYMDFTGSGSSPSEFPVSLYADLLRYVEQKYRGRYWHTLPRELARFWSDSGLERGVTGSSSARSSGLPGSKPGGANPRLAGKKAAVVLYSDYPGDARPRREAEALVEAGMEVDMICLREEPAEAKSEVINGVRVRRIPLRRRRSGKAVYFFQYTVFLAACAAILAWRSLRRRYHLVHCHNMPDVLAFSGLVPKMLGAKIVLDLHDPMPELLVSIFHADKRLYLLSLLKSLERRSIAFSDLVLTPNIAFRDLFASRSCPASKIVIVMNSPESGLFDPGLYGGARPRAKESSKGFSLMYHGLLVERHGLHLAIAGVKELTAKIPGLEFHIYGGRTPYMTEMEAEILRLGLTDVVRYHGPKSQRTIAESIMGVDLGVIPNLRTPFTEINMPTRIFEYLAMDCPVLAPRTKGIMDYFNERELVFFDPDKPGDLTEKILWAYSHPAELREMLLRAKVKYRNHRWESEKARFLEAVGRTIEVGEARE